MEEAVRKPDPMSYPDRLQASAARIDALKEQLKAEYSIRDHLCVSMCDDGYPQHKVAEWARFSRSNLNRLLATPMGLFPEAEPGQQ